MPSEKSNLQVSGKIKVIGRVWCLVFEGKEVFIIVISANV